MFYRPFNLFLPGLEDGDVLAATGASLRRPLRRGETQASYPQTLQNDGAYFDPVQLELQNEIEGELESKSHSFSKQKTSRHKAETHHFNFKYGSKVKQSIRLKEVHALPYSCSFCWKTFKSKWNLHQHERKHITCTTTTPYECVSGERELSKKKSAKEKTAKKDLFPCMYCGKQFQCRQHCAQHEFIHTGEKPHKCTICDKSFALKGNLNLHYKFHMQDKPHQCTYCGKRFVLKNSMHVHERTHTGEKPFKCSVCDKAFSSVASQMKHAQIHTEEKPFKCDVCAMSFRYKTVLNEHNKRHTGQLPKCGICGKSYVRVTDMRRHERTHDVGNAVQTWTH